MIVTPQSIPVRLFNIKYSVLKLFQPHYIPGAYNGLVLPQGTNRQKDWFTNQMSDSVETLIKTWKQDVTLSVTSGLFGDRILWWSNLCRRCVGVPPAAPQCSAGSCVWTLGPAWCGRVLRSRCTLTTASSAAGAQRGRGGLKNTHRVRAYSAPKQESPVRSWWEFSIQHLNNNQ